MAEGRGVGALLASLLDLIAALGATDVSSTLTPPLSTVDTDTNSG
jgi:hypothetical protein